MARIACEITGLKPLWLPRPLRDAAGRLAISHRVITIDLVRHLDRKGVLHADCYVPNSRTSSYLWPFVQVHPTLPPIEGRAVFSDGVLVHDWRVAFGLLLPLGLFNIENPVIKTEIAGDPALYAALSLAEVGRAKGLLRTNDDYGTYTVSRWEVKEITKLYWRNISWMRSDD